MNISAFHELKTAIKEIQEEIEKTQYDVENSFKNAKNRLKDLLGSIENVEQHLGFVVNTTKEEEKPVIETKTTGSAREWKINIIKLLRTKKLTTAEVFDWFLKNDMIRVDTKKNRSRDHANVRCALHNLKKNKIICQVENTRGAAWKLTEAYKKEIKKQEEGEGIQLDF